MNPITADRRHFEDLALGEVVGLGKITVTKEMITSFAREFDPFPFHLDEEAAKKSLLGGLASSGWQTAGLTLRLLTDAFLNRIASAGGLGFSDLKWKRPVMKNDTITGTGRIIELRRSKSHPQWGVLTLELDMRNQRNEPVMGQKLTNLIETRTPGIIAHEQPAQPYDVESGHKPGGVA